MVAVRQLKLMTDDLRHAQNAAYCTERAKKYSEDLFLAAQFAPTERHAGLMALYAFAGEVNRIPASVSDPTLGAIRQQWWHDALGEVFGQTPRVHPVVEALASAIGTDQTVFRQAMDEAIKAVGFFLEPGDFKTPDHILCTALKTHGYVARLGAALLDPENSAVKTGPDLLDRLGALAAIGRMLAILKQDSVAPREGGGVETFSARLMRFAATNRDELLSFLPQEYSKARKKIGLPETKIMPALAQTALLPGYVKQARGNPAGTSRNQPFLSVKKRLILFRTILLGRL